MIPLSHFLILSLVMFVTGAVGFMIRKNVLVVFMCLELMLNAVNVSFIAFARHHGNLDGEISVFFVMVVAAAEAAVGLAIVLALFRNRESVDSTDADAMRR